MQSTFMALILLTMTAPAIADNAQMVKLAHDFRVNASTIQRENDTVSAEGGGVGIVPVLFKVTYRCAKKKPVRTVKLEFSICKPSFSECRDPVTTTDTAVDGNIRVVGEYLCKA